MNQEKFKDMVRNEINCLKASATSSEITRLEDGWTKGQFNHAKMDSCILGLMTGDCMSARSLQLLTKEFNDIHEKDLPSDHPTRLQTKVKASYHSWKRGNNYTALEKWMYIAEYSEIQNVVSYLIGSTGNLEIN
jgi:hypothetical protein